MSTTFRFGRNDDGPLPEGNGKAPFDLSRGRLSAQERGLLHHLQRLAAAHPGRAFHILDAWLQYSAYADSPNGENLRAGFDAALAGLHEKGLAVWSGDTVRLP